MYLYASCKLPNQFVDVDCGSDIVFDKTRQTYYSYGAQFNVLLDG
jgi:hypothetical protein